MRLFVDTSAFYAAADSSDSYHQRAARALTEEGDPLLTTDHVLLETWFLLDAHIGRHAAQAFWSAIRDGAADVAPVGPADLDRAWTIASNFPNLDFSIVDMTSFAVMERLGVHRVASFDHHFAIHRFGPHRDRAFQLVV